MKYWLSPTIKWGVFKRIQYSFPRGGIEPMHIDKVLWQGLRDRYFNIYIDTKQIIITTKSPSKGDKIIK